MMRQRHSLCMSVSHIVPIGYAVRRVVGEWRVRDGTLSSRRIKRAGREAATGQICRRGKWARAMRPTNENADVTTVTSAYNQPQLSFSASERLNERERHPALSPYSPWNNVGVRVGHSYRHVQSSSASLGQTRPGQEQMSNL